MDRRTLVAVALSLLVYFAWMQWVGDGEAAPAPDGAELVDGSPALEVQSPEPVTAPPAPTVVAAETTPVRTGSVEICGSTLSYTTDGGRVTDVEIGDHQSPYQVTPIWTWLIGRVSGSIEGPWLPYGPEPGVERLTSGDAALFVAGSGSYAENPLRAQVVSEGPDRVEWVGVTADGVEVRTKLGPGAGEPCVASIEVTWRNTTNTVYSGGVWLGLHDVVPVSAGRYDSVLHPYAMVDGDLETRNNLKKVTEPEPYDGPVDWLALSDRYFAAAVVPSGAGQGIAALSPLSRGDQTLYGVHYRVAAPLQAGAQHTETFRVYVGPLAYDVLSDVAPGLRELVQLGWFAFFGRILMFLLHGFYGFVGNWGVSIILLTLFVKTVFFPLTQASMKSSQGMQVIQPQMAQIREQYKDNPEELNRRTLALFREHGVNPLSGCLPMLAQMPVWIALYNLLLTSVDLYHVPFLYLKDLSVPDPYGALPLVVVIVMAIQQQMMPMGNMDPVQARMMKVMPIIFGVFFFTFPSGLVVYIFVNMILTILQQWWIKRRFAAVTSAA
jgi:YidC/Oxa1 family membrane protein insertase